MTEQDKKAVLGNLAYEYSQAKGALVALRAEATRLAKTFSALALELRTAPGRIKIEGQTICIMRDKHVDSERFPAADLDVKNIEKLAADVARTTEIINRITPQLRELGVL